MDYFDEYFIKNYRFDVEFYQTIYNNKINLEKISELIYVQCNKYYLKKFGSILDKCNFEGNVKEYIFNRFIESTLIYLDEEGYLNVNRSDLVREHIMIKEDVYKNNKDLYESAFNADYKYVSRYIDEKQISTLLITKRQFYINHIKLLKVNDQNKKIILDISKKRYEKISILDLEKFYENFSNEYITKIPLEGEYKYYAISKLIKLINLLKSKKKIHDINIYDLIPIIFIPDVKLRLELIRIDYINDLEQNIKQVMYLYKIFYRIIDYNIYDIISNLDTKYLIEIIEEAEKNINKFKMFYYKDLNISNDKKEFIFKDLAKKIKIYRDNDMTKNFIDFRYIKERKSHQIYIEEKYSQIGEYIKTCKINLIKESKKNINKCFKLRKTNLKDILRQHYGILVLKIKYKNFKKIIETKKEICKNEGNELADNYNKFIFNKFIKKMYRSFIISEKRYDPGVSLTNIMNMYSFSRDIDFIYKQHEYSKEILN